MFGCEACYVDGRLVLVLADTEEPWNGLLVPTEREHQPKLRAQYPALSPHPILPKWLYLPAELDQFETVAQAIVRSICMGNELIGVIPSEKRKRRKKGAKPKKRKVNRTPRD
jgi:hypothetical protein